MITTLEIKNFRCFEHVDITGLRKVNVVTGSNASGKTALLEAVYVGANATAAAIQNIGAMRSIALPMNIIPGVPIPVPVSNNLGAYFDHLFRATTKNGKHESAAHFSVSFNDSDLTRYDLKVGYQQNSEAPNLVAVSRGPGGVGPVVPIIFERRKTFATGTAQDSNTPISMNQFGQLQQMQVGAFGPVSFMFAAGMDYAEVDNVTWFSQLRERNESDKVVNFIRKEFPFVEGLEVLAPAGVNGLYVRLADGSTRRASVVSAGINKIISVFLSAAFAHDGVIIIDEIENGVFYEKYGALWRGLYDFAKTTGNQIFVSSHSAECLAALPDVIGDDVDDFCLLRTERVNGSCFVQQSSGISMKAALSGGNEIRGVTNGGKVDK